jgi:hypothetical protein
MSDVKKWELTDIVRITDHGKEVTTCTGYEVCDAFGFARNKGMLIALCRNYQARDSLFGYCGCWPGEGWHNDDGRKSARIAHL